MRPPYRSFARCLLLCVASVGHVHASTLDDLMSMTEKLDKMDKMELGEALGKADRCTAARNFDCSEAELQRARKYASGGKDRDALARSEQALLAEREKAAEEARRIAQRERELRESEERLREAEARAERQARAAAREEDSGMSTGQAIALFGSLMNQSLQNQAALRAADAARARQFTQGRAELEAQVQRQQQQFARERAELEARRAALQRQQAATQAARLQPSQAKPEQHVRPTAVAATSPPAVRGLEGISQNTLANLGARHAGIDLAALDRRPTQDHTAERQAAAERAAAEQRQQEALAAAQRQREEQQAREQERQAQAEKNRAERQAQREAERLAAEQAKEAMPKALAFCWQNAKHTLWWCDGRVQEIIIGEEDRAGLLKSVGCPDARLLSRDPLTLTRRRNGQSRTGYLFDCGYKLQVGDTTSMTWNRDIRNFWNGIPTGW